MFVSPGYPNEYGHNLVCNYTIVVDPQRFIVFNFFRINFHLEGKLLYQLTLCYFLSFYLSLYEHGGDVFQFLSKRSHR